MIIILICADASKNTAKKRIRALFLEFEGHIEFRKKVYLMFCLATEDIILLVFGALSRKRFNTARATKLKRKMNTLNAENNEVLLLLKNKDITRKSFLS